MKLKARKTQTLENHLSNVSDYSQRIVKRKRLESSLLEKEKIEKLSRILGATHDFGKGTEFFQRYLSSEDSNPPKKKTRHSSLSAFYTYHVLKKEEFSELIATLGWQTIQKHHGNLTNLFKRTSEGRLSEIERKTDPSHKSLIKEQIQNIENNTQARLNRIYERLDLNHLETFFKVVKSEEIFKDIKVNRIRLRQKLKEKDNLSAYYLLLFLYSVLLDADRTNSAGLGFDEWPSVGHHTSLSSEIVNEYKEKRLTIGSKLDEKREQAFNQVSSYIGDTDERLFSLTLPTGGGKTLTALNSALKIRNRIEDERPPRIIYSLPFLSIIDQNYGVMKDILSANKIEPKPDILLRHDHKSSGFAESGGDDEDSDRALLLTEGWNSEMITTTFVQFFETLIATKSSKARKFHKMTNSVVLLDEIQAVPVKYWEVIREGIKTLTNEFNSYVILLTATNPLIFKPREEITETVEDYRKYFEDFDRIDYAFHMEGETTQNLKNIIMEKIEENPQKDVMVVLNTLGSSKKFFEMIENEVDREKIYLSTNILPKHREERINKIKNSEGPLLIVTTQLVEAGVDIDIDLVYRDFAPLDSIVQAAGRCNRENEGDRGEVHIFRLRDEEGPRDFYYQYIYDSVLLDITEKVLSEFGDGVSETKFNSKAIKQYFTQVNKKKSLNPDEILEDLADLSCGDISFSLIQEDYQTVSVFVEIDQNASEVYQKVEEVCEKHKGFERKEKILNLKADFYNYILDVKVGENEDALSHLPATAFSDEVRRVPRDKIERWYDERTGFQFPESTVEERLI